MKREEIEKAAIELCTSEKQEEWLKYYGIHCFLDGARWRISSVWHKAEKPDENKPCLVEYKSPNNGKTRYKVSVYCGYEWKELTHYEHSCTIRWAYIEDLLPNKED